MRSLQDLALVLRELRRRHARLRGTAELTYRELAARTGWSHGIIGEYLAGRILPPTDRFDALIRLLGATPEEQGALATARDRVEEGRRSPAAAAAGGATVPRQLPAEAFGFSGRAGPLEELDALLSHGAPGRAVVISAVSGTAGVGKTTLAVRWAHRVADRFPDGQLYVDLRGYDEDSPIPAADALARFLRGLGVAASDIPAELDERAAHYRTLLAGRRMLVLLDNASGVDHVRPLLPGTPTCLALITSRSNLAGLVAREGARRIDLDVLGEAEAVALLRAVIGSQVDADPGAAADVARLCAHLPLALRIAAQIAVAHPAMTLAELADDLRDEARRIDRLSVPDDPRTAVRSVFSWSFNCLSAEAAQAFTLLGLHPGREIDVPDVAALAGCGLAQAQAAVDELAQAHLIEPTGGGSFTMHDLLRAYAKENAPMTRTPLTRLFDHYTRTAGAAADALFPHDRVGRPEVVPPAAPLSWLDRHRANLVAIAGFAARDGWPRHGVDLSRILWRYFEVGGHYAEALAVHTAADVAAQGGAPTVLANLGNVHWWLGDYRDALAYFQQALAGHRAAGDRDGEARALARLGVVHERLGDYEPALARLDEALARYRADGNRHGEGVQLVNLGALHRRCGRYAEAAAHHELAARIFTEVGDRRLEGYALGNLGADCRLLGRHAEALDHLERALERCRESADPGGQASAIAAIAAVHLATGEHESALDGLRSALEMSRETSDRGLETEVLNDLGETLRALHRYASALDHHEAALALTERTGDPFERARALDGMAHARRGEGELAPARELWQEALDSYARLGVPQAQTVRDNLSRAARLS